MKVTPIETITHVTITLTTRELIDLHTGLDALSTSKTVRDLRTTLHKHILVIDAKDKELNNG